MWKRNLFRSMHPSFLIAEQLIALTILAMLVTSLIMVTQQVGDKRRKLERDLLASRLVKEATDEVMLGNKYVEISRQGIHIQATLRGARAIDEENKILVTVGGD